MDILSQPALLFNWLVFQIGCILKVGSYSSDETKPITVTSHPDKKATETF